MKERQLRIPSTLKKVPCEAKRLGVLAILSHSPLIPLESAEFSQLHWGQDQARGGKAENLERFTTLYIP